MIMIIFAVTFQFPVLDKLCALFECTPGDILHCIKEKENVE
ncbi:MAG: helix-turn-helix domain-containing protein [Clostridiaceae bacterium]|nr:helix-turn-helix domain-containing protein [Clostridiaceae bacterium]